jgi:hypothetical protein
MVTFLYMATDILLINGVSLPYHVLDKGIQHVKSTGNELRGVFIYENDDDDDKYRFPSDIELSKADYTHATAEKNLVDLIGHNAAFVESYYQRHNISIQTVILQNPTIDQIVRSVSDAEKVFIDPETFRYPDEFAYVNYNYKEITHRLSPKLQHCDP